MDLTGLLVQVVSGAIGGSAAGAAAKQYSLGALGNAIAGAVGGGIVGQLIGTFAGQMVEGWVGNIAGGAVGGIVLTLPVGVIRETTKNSVRRDRPSVERRADGAARIFCARSRSVRALKGPRRAYMQIMTHT